MKMLGIGSLRALSIVMFWLFAASIAISQINGLVPIESSHWHLEGDAKLSEYLDRKTIRVDGGSAELDNVVMQDGVIDVDVATRQVVGSSVSNSGSRKIAMENGCICASTNRDFLTPFNTRLSYELG
ncbi:MAG TPA: hypothetical protein VHR84_16550 [Terriglobales bacterium]|jgi:hypothetical protein|nr:hypothetical protein [Terriglobales bacterium]